MKLEKSKIKGMASVLQSMEHCGSNTHLAIEHIQDIIEEAEVLDKEFILDMLQAVIATHHNILEDLEDIKCRYGYKE